MSDLQHQYLIQDINERRLRREIRMEQFKRIGGIVACVAILILIMWVRK